MSSIDEISLEGLPMFVRDTEGQLFVTCMDTDPVERVVNGVKVGILTVLDDYVGSASAPTVVNIAIVLEENIVLADVADLPLPTCLDSFITSTWSFRMSSGTHLKWSNTFSWN